MTIEFKSPLFQSDVSGNAVHWTSYQHTSGLNGHAGLDFPVQDGTPIRASADGKLIRSFNHSDFGNLIVIDHGDQFHTLYAHMKNDGFVDSSGNLINSASLSNDGKIVVDGQEVSGAKSIKDYLSVNYDDDATNDVEISVNSGDVIGFVGDTGIGGTHLHFSILDLNETEAQSLGKKDGDPFGVFELPNSLIPWNDIDSDGDGTTRSDADYTNNRLAQYNAVLNRAPEIAALADHPNEVTNWEGRWDEGFTTFTTLSPTNSFPDAALGSIERNGDKDWFRLETTDGHTYEITVSGTTVNDFQSLSDPFFTVRKLNESKGMYEIVPEAAGDRTDMSGASETITFTAKGGNYYVVVGGGGDNFATEKGGYSVAVSDTTNAVDPTLPYSGVNVTTSFADAADDFGVADGSDVAELYLESIFGAAITNVTYTGSEDAAFLVSDFEIPGVDVDLEGGILLSSGGFPGSSNTSTGFSVSHGTPGDSDLSAVASDAFSGAGVSLDASILEFDIFVDDPDVDGIRFDIVFGSDEYPEYSNTSVIDVAAVFVNGDNKALFNGDSDTPLSVIDENLALNFVDNTSGIYPIEWDGFGALSVRPSLNQDENSIKIAVSDTGDRALDSAIYVTNFELLRDGATGDDIFKVVNGAVGQNDLDASETKEEFNLAEGSGSVSGTLKELTGDVVTGFTEQIKLIIEKVNLLKEWISITFGSAILNIDEDGDGDVDGTITLEGDFEGAEFEVEVIGEDSVITVNFNSLEDPAVPVAASRVFAQPAVEIYDGTLASADSFAPLDDLKIPEGAIAFSFVVEDLEGRQGLVSKDALGFAGGGNHFSARLDGDQLIVRFQDGANSREFVVDGIVPGQEVEFAAVFSGDGVGVYLDGALVGFDDTFGMSWGGNDEWLNVGGLGWRSATGANDVEAPLNGKVIDLEIYDGLLSEAEIAALAAASSLPVNDPVDPLTALRVFDQPGVVSYDGTQASIDNYAPDPDLNIAEGTIAFSFVVDDTKGRQGLIAKDALGFAGGGNHFSARLDGGQLIVRFQDGANSREFVVDGIVPGQEVEFAAVFSGDGVGVYIDGALVEFDDTFAMSWVGNDEWLNVGGLGWRSATGANDVEAPLKGLIVDLAIYDGVLDNAQIQDLANDSSLSPSDPVDPVDQPDPLADDLVFEQPGIVAYDGSEASIGNYAPDPDLNIAEGTIGFSFEANDTDGQQGLVAKDALGFQGGGNHFSARLDDDTLVVRFQDGADSFDFVVDGINSGQEYEVAAVFNDGGVGLYVDGILIGQEDTFGMSWETNDEWLNVGGLGWRSATGASDVEAPFNGRIADLQIFDSVLVEADIIGLATTSSMDLI